MPLRTLPEARRLAGGGDTEADVKAGVELREVYSKACAVLVAASRATIYVVEIYIMNIRNEGSLLFYKTNSEDLEMNQQRATRGNESR